MSLFPQKHIQNSSLNYIYLVFGGFSGVLMLFFLKNSLPLNQQQEQNYHLSIQEARQEVFAVEKNIIQLIYNKSQANNNLNIQLENTHNSLEKLQELPEFLTRQQQKNLTSKLQEQIVLFADQKKIIQQLYDNKISLDKSCQYIPKIRNEFDNASDSIDINLKFLTNSLLKNIIFTCYENNDSSILSIETQIKIINNFFDKQENSEYQILFVELIEHSNNIIDCRKAINKTKNKIFFSTLENKIIDYEKKYFNHIEDLKVKINIYRGASYLFSLSILIFISYKIIRNLTKTNHNIVKILENFTQELETKVEQRTALLEESIQNTEAALSEAQNANKAKSRFLANMSHELRTPLNAILGFTQLMYRDSSISKEHKENIQIINRSGEHLLKLINDILEMSKIEVGQITLNEVKFDFYTMLKSIEDMLKLKVKAKRINLTFKIDKNIPQYIYSDEGKLRQILINLLGNALKFTEQGEIILTVELKNNTQLEEANIDFLFSDTFALKFAIKDTGAGIPEDEMERLFSPFEQTKIGRLSNEGTGLGLSICQKFVELMGGTLQVESVVGEGSIFSFETLIKLQDTSICSTPNHQEIDETRQVVGIAGNKSEYRILAVDDVPASRLLLRKILTEIGFVVKEASDGQQAIDLFSSWHPDLILMDMRMPVVDGYEATKKIKALPEGDKTIIIALTASAFEEEKVVILSAGCDDFMRKPFYEAELVEKIGKYLNIDYLYEKNIEYVPSESTLLATLTPESLEVMSLDWRSQLYDAAAKVDNHEILNLLSDIPEEYEYLARGLENLVEHFRCDKIIDLTKPAN